MAKKQIRTHGVTRNSTGVSCIHPIILVKVICTMNGQGYRLNLHCKILSQFALSTWVFVHHNLCILFLFKFSESEDVWIYDLMFSMTIDVAQKSAYSAPHLELLHNLNISVFPLVAAYGRVGYWASML